MMGTRLADVSSSGPQGGSAQTMPDEAFDILVWFGSLMWRAGNTAIRTREWMEIVGRKLGFDDVAVSLSIETITVSVHSVRGWSTTMRAITSPVPNAWRIAQLEEIARATEANAGCAEIRAQLAAIEAARPLYSGAETVAAIALASGSFAFLNGAGSLEMIATAIGGGSGQWLRSQLSHCRLNQYGVAALSAIMATGVYVLMAMLADALGFGFGHYATGFVASVLFLVPGFPLIGALFDLLQLQTVAAMSRVANAAMILLAAALGLTIVVAFAGVDLSRPPPLALAYPVKLLLRAVASFFAGSAFALLFNTPPRVVLGVGLLSMVANGLRLTLHDAGLMLAPAAFLSALVIGVVALSADRRFKVPRMAMTVAPIVIMIPGVSAFDAVAFLNQERALEAIEAAAVCGFVVGALAMGLATARFFSS